MEKSWGELSAYAAGDIEICFLGLRYRINASARTVEPENNANELRTYTLILLLHYAIAVYKGLPSASGEWVSFNQLPGGGEFYYPSFRKRAIEPLLRKYGADTRAALSAALKRLPGAVGELAEGDCAFTAEILNSSFFRENSLPVVSNGVSVKLTFWNGDEEFPAEAAMFFDRSISGLFCTEDVAVLAGIVSSSL